MSNLEKRIERLKNHGEMLEWLLGEFSDTTVSHTVRTLHLLNDSQGRPKVSADSIWYAANVLVAEYELERFRRWGGVYFKRAGAPGGIGAALDAAQAENLELEKG